MENLCGRPLTFGDEEQIRVLQEATIASILEKDTEFLAKRKKYLKLACKIEDLQGEQDEVYDKIFELVAKKCKEKEIPGITFSDIYKFI